MTAKERVMAGVGHQETEKIPTTFDAEKEVYRALYDHLQVKTNEELFDRLHADTWMILPGNFIYTADEDKKTEKTATWGYKTRVTRYSGGTYDEAFHNPLAGKDTIADIKAHKWPPPEILGFEHFPGEAKAHSDRAVIGVFTWGAFFIACYIRGLEDLLIDFALRKDYAHYLIDTIDEICATALRTMLESYGSGIDIVFMCDDYCSQLAPLFSPAAFREFVMPYLRELVGIVHQYDKKFLLHCCGAVRQLIPMIIDAGVDMLEPLQTRAEGMEPLGLKRDFGKDLCFYGGVDLQHILCRGTTQQVADEVKRLIDVLGEQGGYILGPGHTYIQTDAPIENIMAMYETASSYRRAGR